MDSFYKFTAYTIYALGALFLLQAVIAIAFSAI